MGARQARVAASSKRHNDCNWFFRPLGHGSTPAKPKSRYGGCPRVCTCKHLEEIEGF